MFYKVIKKKTLSEKSVRIIQERSVILTQIMKINSLQFCETMQILLYILDFVLTTSTLVSHHINKHYTFPVYKLKFSTESTRVYSTCNRGGVTAAFVDGFIQTEPDCGNKLSRANAPAHCSAGSEENWPRGLQNPPYLYSHLFPYCSPSFLLIPDQLCRKVYYITAAPAAVHQF